MKRFSFSLVAAAALVLAGCNSGPKVDLAAEEKAVRDVSMHWLDLAKSKDAAGQAALFAAEGIAYREHVEPIVGPAAIQAYVTDDNAKNPKGEISWTTTAVTVAAAGELAVETGTYHLTGGGANGTAEDKGTYITVYKKLNGAWKVTADIGSSSMPEAPPPKAVPAKAPPKKAPAKPPAKAPAKKKK